MSSPAIKQVQPRLTDTHHQTYAWVAKGHWSLDEMVRSAMDQFNVLLYIFDNGPGKLFSHGPYAYSQGSRTILKYSVALDI